MKRIAIVCSSREWETSKTNILRLLKNQQDTNVSLYLTDGNFSNKSDEIPVFSLNLLNPYKAEQIIFISLYDFAAAAYVYRLKIKDVLLFHNDGYFLHDAKETLAYQKEQYYILLKKYHELKQLNRMRMLLDYFHRETELASYPICFQIESTSYCNAECIMCGHYIYKNSIAKHIPMQLIENLEKYLMYAETVILHGVGEPFLHPRIIDIIHFYGKYDIKIVTNTNLSILNPDILECIRDHFSEIEVSIDGCTREIYESIRINLCFDTLLKNINLLNKFASKIPKKIAVVATRQNLHQLPDFIMFAKNNGFYAVKFSTITSNKMTQNQVDEIQNYPETASLQLKRAMILAKKYNIEIELPYQLILPCAPDIKKLNEEQKEIQKTPMFPNIIDSQRLFDTYIRPRLEELKSFDKQEVCYSDYTSFPLTWQIITDSIKNSSCCGICDFVIMNPYVQLEGKVSSCCLRKKYYIGIIQNDVDLALIWNNQKIQKIRRQFYNGKIPVYCTECSFMNNHFLKLGVFNI